jgi:hypothetical protein
MEQGGEADRAQNGPKYSLGMLDDDRGVGVAVPRERTWMEQGGEAASGVGRGQRGAKQKRKQVA